MTDGSQPRLWTLLQSDDWAVDKYHTSHFTVEETGAQRTQTYAAHHQSQEGSLYLSAAQSTDSEAAWTEPWTCTWSSYWRMLTASGQKAVSMASTDHTLFSWKTRGIWLRNSAGDMPYISCHIRHWENPSDDDWEKGKKWMHCELQSIEKRLHFQ